MFSSSLRASLVALVASAIAVSATPGLTVTTSIPSDNVDGLGNLKITATVTNTGDQTLKLLKDPRGVLSTFPENTFSITDATGSGPSFNGAKVNHASVVWQRRVLMFSVSVSRSSTAPHTLLVVMTPALSPFSLLALLLISFTIVSWSISITFGSASTHGTITLSLRCVQLHWIWIWRLFHRAIDPLHLCRRRRFHQGPRRHCWGCC